MNRFLSTASLCINSEIIELFSWFMSSVNWQWSNVKATQPCVLLQQDSKWSSGNRIKKNERQEQKNLLFILHFTMCALHIFFSLLGTYELLQKNMWMNKWIATLGSFLVPFAKCHEKLAVAMGKGLENNSSAIQLTATQIYLSIVLNFDSIQSINIFNGFNAKSIVRCSYSALFCCSQLHCIHVIKWPLIELSILMCIRLAKCSMDTWLLAINVAAKFN